MDPGDLRHKITIQTLTTSIGTNGFTTESWTNLKTVWAKAQGLFGREFFAAQQVNSKASCKFIIRYIANLDTSMRIAYEGKNYNILYIDDIKEEHKYIEMMAEVIDDA